MATVPPSTARQAIERAFPVDVATVDHIDKGVDTLYTVTLGDGAERVAKFHTYGGADRRFAEPYIYRWLAGSTDVPVPQVFHIEPDPVDTAPFFLMERIDGHRPERVDADDLLATRRLFRRVGDCLRQVHGNVRFDRCGRVAGDDDGLWVNGGTETWPVWFREMTEIRIDGMADRFDGHRDRAREVLTEHLSDVPDAEPVLVHQDNALNNLLVDDDGLVAFLDWGHPSAGAATYDIVMAEHILVDHDHAHLDARHRDELRDALFEGYGSDVRGTQAYWLYRFSSVLWLMHGFRDWGPDIEPSLRERIADRVVDQFEEAVRNIG